jgi:hypothetical protein
LTLGPRAWRARRRVHFARRAQRQSLRFTAATTRCGTRPPRQSCRRPGGNAHNPRDFLPRAPPGCALDALTPLRARILNFATSRLGVHDHSTWWATHSTTTTQLTTPTLSLGNTLDLTAISFAWPHSHAHAHFDMLSWPYALTSTTHFLITLFFVQGPGRGLCGWRCGVCGRVPGRWNGTRAVRALVPYMHAPLADSSASLNPSLRLCALDHFATHLHIPSTVLKALCHRMT